LRRRDGSQGSPDNGTTLQ